MKHYKKTIKKLEKDKKTQHEFYSRLIYKINNSFENPYYISRLLDIYLRLRPVSIQAWMLKAAALNKIKEIKEEKRKNLKTQKVVNFNDYKS